MKTIVLVALLLAATADVRATDTRALDDLTQLTDLPLRADGATVIEVVPADRGGVPGTLFIAGRGPTEGACFPRAKSPGRSTWSACWRPVPGSQCSGRGKCCAFRGRP